MSDNLNHDLAVTDYQPQRERMKKWAKAHYIDEFKIKGRLLDAGCGDGFWSSVFYEYGIDPTGIDPTRSSIEKGRRQWPHLDLRILSIEDAYKQDYKGWDIVFARGVSPFYKDQDKATELIDMLITMGDRVLLALYTHQNNEPNSHGHMMWSEDVFRGMIDNAGGKVLKSVFIANFLQIEVVNALS
jgi:SAM-dependent methyltransferase